MGTRELLPCAFVFSCLQKIIKGFIWLQLLEKNSYKKMLALINSEIFLWQKFIYKIVISEHMVQTNLMVVFFTLKQIDQGFPFLGMEDKLTVQTDLHLFSIRLFCAEAISPVSHIFARHHFLMVLYILLYMVAFQLMSRS